MRLLTTSFYPFLLWPLWQDFLCWDCSFSVSSREILPSATVTTSTICCWLQNFYLCCWRLFNFTSLVPVLSWWTWALECSSSISNWPAVIIPKLTFHCSSFLLQAFIILLPQHLTWRRESSFNLLSLLNTILPTTSQSSCLSEICLSNLPFLFRSFVQLLIASCSSYLLDNYLSAFCITPTLI